MWRNPEEEVPQSDCEVWMMWAGDIPLRGYFEKTRHQLDGVFTYLTWVPRGLGMANEGTPYRKIISPTHWMPIEETLVFQYNAWQCEYCGAWHSAHEIPPPPVDSDE